jgi:hypothetical protein
LSNEKDNIIYKTSEWQKVFQEKILTPFKTALIQAEHLSINNNIKNINLSSEYYLFDILIRMVELK